MLLKTSFQLPPFTVLVLRDQCILLAFSNSPLPKPPISPIPPSLIIIPRNPPHTHSPPLHPQHLLPLQQRQFQHLPRIRPIKSISGQRHASSGSCVICSWDGVGPAFGAEFGGDGFDAA